MPPGADGGVGYRRWKTPVEFCPEVCGFPRRPYHPVHSLLLNLGLLHPAEFVARVLAASEAGQAPLASVEVFVR